MSSVEGKIERRIKSRPRGTILFAGDFMEFGTPEAIRQALVRLVSKGVLRRVSQGIYVRPAMSDYIGEVLPSAGLISGIVMYRAS